MEMREILDAMILPEHLDAHINSAKQIRVYHVGGATAEVGEPGGDWYVSASWTGGWVITGNIHCPDLPSLIEALAGRGIGWRGEDATPEPDPTLKKITRAPLSVLIERRDFIQEISAHLTHASERHEDWLRLSAQHGPDWLHAELSAVRADALAIRASTSRDRLRAVTEDITERETALLNEATELRFRLVEIESDLRRICE